jgi:hypothetical protein
MLSGILTFLENKLTAAKLVTNVEDFKRKYGKASNTELLWLVPRDVGDEHYRFDGDSVVFAPPELRDFQIWLFSLSGDRTEREAYVWGRGKYHGFSLHAEGAMLEWRAFASDSPFASATRLSKDLVRHLSKGYGIQDGNHLTTRRWFD